MVAPADFPACGGDDEGIFWDRSEVSGVAGVGVGGGGGGACVVGVEAFAGGKIEVVFVEWAKGQGEFGQELEFGRRSAVLGKQGSDFGGGLLGPQADAGVDGRQQFDGGRAVERGGGNAHGVLADGEVCGAVLGQIKAAGADVVGSALKSDGEVGGERAQSGVGGALGVEAPIGALVLLEELVALGWVGPIGEVAPKV